MQPTRNLGPFLKSAHGPTKMADNADEIDAVCVMAVIVLKQRANRKEKNGNEDPTTEMQLHAQLSSNMYL